MTLFVRLFLLSAFFSGSESKHECAFTESYDKYYDGKRWNINDATFDTEYQGKCQIVFKPDTCEIRIGKKANLFDEKCVQYSTGFECACSGRFCNLNIPYFQNKINREFQGGLAHCHYEGAPPVDTASRAEIKCLTGTSGRRDLEEVSYFKMANVPWRKPDETTTVTSRLCAIGFLSTCTVQLYKPAGNYGVKYFDSCAYYADTDEAYCQCIHEDHCNADIGYWLEKAKKVKGISLAHCDFSNLPVYPEAKNLRHGQSTNPPPNYPNGQGSGQGYNPGMNRGTSSSLVLVSIAATTFVAIAAM